MEVLQEYAVQEKVVCSATDNALNETNAMRDAGIPNFGGFAHTLNLAVKTALNIASGADIDDFVDVEDAEDSPLASQYELLHKKISKLVTRTKKSSNAKREFKQCQEAVNHLKAKKDQKKILRLKQFVPTRWNSR